MTTKSNAIEQAMADALAAVERIEKEGRQSTALDEPTIEVAAPAEEAVATEPEPTTPAAAAAAATAVTEIGEPVPTVPRDQFLRLAADFENYRRRAARDLEDARRYGIERLLKDLLPMLDNLDRALAHAEGDKSPLVEGIRMVAKQAHEILAGHGVKAFTSLGQPFDPEQHEAVAQVPSAEHPAGSVMEEMLRGYRIHDRLLRAAQVVVAAAPPASEQPAASPPMDGGAGSGA